MSKLRLSITHHGDRGKFYDLTDGGFTVASFDEEDARLVYALLRDALDVHQNAQPCNDAACTQQPQPANANKKGENTHD